MDEEKRGRKVSKKYISFYGLGYTTFSLVLLRSFCRERVNIAASRVVKYTRIMGGDRVNEVGSSASDGEKERKRELANNTQRRVKIPCG